MRPPKLDAGDTITIVAPSGKVNPTDVRRATGIFESWNLKVKLSEHLFSDYFQFSGTDDQRRQDLQKAFDDEQTKAIVCARGGYGLTRIVDKVDLEIFKKKPKWLLGYSDITALHYLLFAEGIESIHSIMPSQMGLEGSEIAVTSMYNLLFDDAMQPIRTTSSYNRIGSATGQLIGGNLSLIESMLSTKTDVDYAGKILFIEDVGEYLYRLDRMMVHLDRAGVFRELAGLVVGSFTGMKDGPTAFGTEPYDMVAHICAPYKYPVLYDAPIGHSLNNQAIPVGRRVQLSVDTNLATLTDAGERA